MSNSNGNVITRNIRGKFANQVVFRVRAGESITANVPSASNAEPTAAQEAVRDRFRAAVQWAKFILADPEQYAAYKAKSKPGMNAFSTAVADYLRPPKVKAIDTSRYAGHTGDPISVSAVDDFLVAEVGVVITGTGGEVLEQGTCERNAATGAWIYTAQTDNVIEKGLVITATARDNPDHSGSLSVTL